MSRSEFWRVQVGTYKSIRGAKRKVQELQQAGYSGTIVKTGDGYKVASGYFEKKENAEHMEQNLQAAGFKNTYIKLFKLRGTE